MDKEVPKVSALRKVPGCHLFRGAPGAWEEGRIQEGLDGPRKGGVGCHGDPPLPDFGNEAQGSKIGSPEGVAEAPCEEDGADSVRVAAGSSQKELPRRGYRGKGELEFPYVVLGEDDTREGPSGGRDEEGVLAHGDDKAGGELLPGMGGAFPLPEQVSVGRDQPESKKERGEVDKTGPAEPPGTFACDGLKDQVSVKPHFFDGAGYGLHAA